MHIKEAACTIARKDLASAPIREIQHALRLSLSKTEISHKAAQQEMADVRTANTPGSDTMLSDPGLQSWTNMGKTTEQPSGADRSETGTMGITQDSHMPPPRRHSTRPSKPPRLLIEEL